MHHLQHILCSSGGLESPQHPFSVLGSGVTPDSLGKHLRYVTVDATWALKEIAACCICKGQTLRCLQPFNCSRCTHRARAGPLGTPGTEESGPVDRRAALLTLTALVLPTSVSAAVEISTDTALEEAGTSAASQPDTTVTSQVQKTVEGFQRKRHKVGGTVCLFMSQRNCAGVSRRWPM